VAENVTTVQLNTMLGRDRNWFNKFSEKLVKNAVLKIVIGTQTKSFKTLVNKP